MLKRSVLVGVLLASTLAVRAQTSGDPTFNGLVAHATCYVRTVNVCRAASCEQVVRGCQGDLCGQLNLHLKTSDFGFSDARKPLHITGVSPAEVGKPLWVTFQLPFTDGGAGEGKLTLKPDRLGGYAGSAVVYVATAADPNGRSFTLFDYDCEQMPDEP